MGSSVHCSQSSFPFGSDESESLAFVMTREYLMNHSLEQIVFNTLCLILDIVVVGRRKADGSMDFVETK